MASKTLSACLLGTFLLVGLVESHGEDDLNVDGAPAVPYDRDTFHLGMNGARNFVMFYAPWCGHCKHLSPTWDELAKIYNKDGSPVVIAKIDCTVHKPLCVEEDIMGFPTLKLYDVGGGGHVRYTGKRDLDSLRKYIKDNVDATYGEPLKQPVAPEVKGAMVHLSDDSFDAYIAKGNHFIKFYAPWCGHCKKLAPVWGELAETFSKANELSIAMLDCQAYPKTCSKYEVRGYPTLLWFAGGKKREEYDGTLSHDGLIHYLFDKIEEEIDEISIEVDEIYKDVDKPNLFPKRPRDPQGEILDLTESNFNAQLKHSQLMFVKFYAPWCGHCKRMAPAWTDLAKEMMGRDIAIAKVDCTKHKSVCAQFKVRGYPTLKMFHKGAEVNDYKGPRALENFVDFVKKYTDGSGRHDEL